MQTAPDFEAWAAVGDDEESEPEVTVIEIGTQTTKKHTRDKINQKSPVIEDLGMQAVIAMEDKMTGTN